MIHISKMHSNIQYNEKSQKKTQQKPISGWFFHVCFWSQPWYYLPNRRVYNNRIFFSTFVKFIEFLL